nr:protein N-lysine methyltransferase METTL21D-like isoform X1 [Cherax quadricarinatus]
MLFTRQIEFESIGKSLFLSQESEGDTGCVVWDAAIVLAKYLEKQRYLLEKQRDLDVRPVRLSDCHVVELGSGTGCVGLTAALLGARDNHQHLQNSNTHFVRDVSVRYRPRYWRVTREPHVGPEV